MIEDLIRVLLIEDNPFDADVLRVNLSALHRPIFEIKTYDRLRPGLEHLRNNEVDVVLLDLSLPDSQGVGTVTHVRNVAPNVPIVVMTGLDDNGTALEAMRKGAQDYLVKGHVSPDDLGRVIRYAIERKRMDLEKDEFISVASHELRSPVAVLKLGLENLQEGLYGPLTEKQMDAVKMASRNAGRLNKIIADLLDISRLESGRAIIHKKAIEIKKLVATSAAESDLKLHTNIEVQVNVPHGVSAVADPDMIEEVLVNLLNNAARYAEKSVQISAMHQNGNVEIVVANDGPGIPEEEQGRVFAKFVQLKRQNGEGYKGSGLGLAICQRIVGLHHGKIWLESGEKNGVAFHFTIPSSE